MSVAEHPRIQVIEAGSHEQYIQFRCSHWMETQHVFGSSIDDYLADSECQTIVNGELAAGWRDNHQCDCELADGEHELVVLKDAVKEMVRNGEYDLWSAET